MSLTLYLIFVMCLCTFAAANDFVAVKIELTIGDNTIYINNEPIEIDAAPILRNNRTMVPIRVIAEALGAEVEWTSYGMKDAVSIVPKDSAYSYNIIIGEKEVIVWNDPFSDDFDPDLEINNILDSPAFIENDRTYLPLRFVSENLGAIVKWNNQTDTVSIYKGIKLYYDNYDGVIDFSCTNQFNRYFEVWDERTTSKHYSYRYLGKWYGDRIKTILDDYVNDLGGEGFDITSHDTSNGVYSYELTDSRYNLRVCYDLVSDETYIVIQ